MVVVEGPEEGRRNFRLMCLPTNTLDTITTSSVEVTTFPIVSQPTLAMSPPLMNGRSPT
jgi:hypothetical protein